MSEGLRKPPQEVIKPFALEKGLVVAPQDIEATLSRQEALAYLEKRAKDGPKYKDGTGTDQYIFDKDARIVIINNGGAAPDSIKGYRLKQDSPLLEK